MMEVRIAIWDDVESVLDRLSDQHRAEYAKAGFPGEGFMTAMAHFMTFADTRCLWFDGKPQAVLAISEDTEVPITWLACTKEFFENGLAATRAARRYMQGAVTRHGTVVSYVASEHPKAIKWMKTIGFTHLGQEQGVEVFEYR